MIRGLIRIKLFRADACDATDVMWASDKSLHFGGRVSSFEYADIWRKRSEMNLDGMSDRVLELDCQMLTY